MACPSNSLTNYLIFNQSISKYIQLVIKFSRSDHLLRYHRSENPFILPDELTQCISSLQYTSLYEIASADGIIDRTPPYDEKELIHNLQDLKDKSQDIFMDIFIGNKHLFSRNKNPWECQIQRGRRASGERFNAAPLKDGPQTLQEQ